MNQENWVAVKGFEGLYEVNIDGKVRSLHKNNYHKEVSQRIDRAGYLTLRLNKKSKSQSVFIHRMLAIMFIPNPNNKGFVNHINGKKLDNRIENLEWVTHAENVKHCYKIGLSNQSNKETPVIDTCTNQFFPSIKKAAEYYSIPYSTCKGYLNGKRKNITCLKYLREAA